MWINFIFVSNLLAKARKRVYTQTHVCTRVLTALFSHFKDEETKKNKNGKNSPTLKCANTSCRIALMPCKAERIYCYAALCSAVTLSNTHFVFYERMQRETQREKEKDGQWYSRTHKARIARLCICIIQSAERDYCLNIDVYFCWFCLWFLRCTGMCVCLCVRVCVVSYHVCMQICLVFTHLMPRIFLCARCMLKKNNMTCRL